MKNLENIQGDERDIILMSVCYGRDPPGRLLMNIGPINQRGGEKRLNVIFSRAKLNMVLVSSLRHSDITNDYNDGANALKQFLHYAESLSRGDVMLARQVLDGLNPLKRQALTPADASNIMSDQIAAAFASRGWLAEKRVGQSRFRSDVAVRAQRSSPSSDWHPAGYHRHHRRAGTIPHSARHSKGLRLADPRYFGKGLVA